MISHRSIRRSLADLAAGDLDRALAAEIEDHLRSCAPCRSEYDRVAGIARLLRESTVAPHESRPVAFWEAFADRVDDRIDVSTSSQTGWREAFLDAMGTVARMRWRTAIGIATAFTVIAVAFLLLRQQYGTEPPPTPATAATVSTADAAFDRKVNRYFTRSQVLLVGLSNARPSVGAPVEPDEEREISRQLAEEARLLKLQGLDPRSAQLVGDLEKIFIELSNTGPTQRAERIDMIRGGIRQENLLFKVRMARARFNADDYQRGPR